MGGSRGARTSSFLQQPLDVLPGIGPVRRDRLAALGYVCVADLLFCLPRDWEDRRSLAEVAELDDRRIGEAVTLRGAIKGARLLRTRKRNLTIVQARFEDERGAELPLVWYNQPWLAKRFSNPRERWEVHGKLSGRRGGGVQLSGPSVEPYPVYPADEDSPTSAAGGEVVTGSSAQVERPGTLVPLYPALGSLGPTAVRRLLGEVIRQIDWDDLPEPLPSELLARYRLPDLGGALRTLHSPPDDTAVEALRSRHSPAWRRLLYGELLLLQLRLAVRRRERLHSGRSRSYDFDAARGVARSRLPFRLTEAQRRVAREIADDMRTPGPMMRLVQGDVGCGKTVLAALMMILAAESSFQAAFLAPTELLAEQHHRSLQKLLGDRQPVALLTASVPDAGNVRRQLATGDCRLVVGTHALLEDKTCFADLALAIVDEQHRFGVEQRQTLRRKGRDTDVLIMTATPIPRSLALTVWGDLDLSVIDELPPGRTPVETRLLAANQRRQAYDDLEVALRRGEQGYVVVPRIDESDDQVTASIERLQRELTTRFGGQLGIVHGRLPGEERRAIMARFERGELGVLLATTVIEVGVDVSSATRLVIENAERFGLAQLHQLRGRVGRGEVPSRCWVIHGNIKPEARARLEVLARHLDGFQIAEADLEMRGAGELIGTRQAGAGPLSRLAHGDSDWLERAQADARRLAEEAGPADLARLVATLERPLLAGEEGRRVRSRMLR